MDRITQFFDIIRKDMSVVLATASGESVTMRQVSPVGYRGNILIFTDPGSLKYQQLKANPNCCISAGLFLQKQKQYF